MGLDVPIAVVAHSKSSAYGAKNGHVSSASARLYTLRAQIPAVGFLIAQVLARATMHCDILAGQWATLPVFRHGLCVIN